LSIPDGDALRQPIRKAIQAGIPVISINSGNDVAKSLGVMTHIGQTEYEAGLGAGERMARDGVQSALCVNHEVGNAALDLRCQGFLDGLQKHGAAAEVLAVDAADPTEMAQRIRAALASRPGTDGVLTLGPLSANPALRVLKENGKLAQVKLGTFDLSPEVLAAVRDGEVLFAIDQQQYLQGYLPIVLLTLYETNLNTPAYDVLRTGPGFVDRSNAAQVIELSKQGTR
jgi:simple sugar transport system substrate-binding protein